MPDKHDPGCRRVMRVPVHWEIDGEFSDCGRYRYKLSQRWAEGPRVLFCLMNPSGADLRVTDMTVSKCARLAQRWGYGGLMVGNAALTGPRTANVCSQYAILPVRATMPRSWKWPPALL